MKFSLTISKTILKTKPSTGEVKNTIRHILETDLLGLTNIVLKVPFITSILNVKGHSPTNADWVSQQIFAIDIDNNIDPEKFLRDCEDFNFEPNIIYSSFSDTIQFRKWRALWILDEPIKDYERAEYFRKYLIKMFNSDEQCKDASRMFYPGKEILYLNEDIMTSNYFESVIDSFVMSKMRNSAQFRRDFEHKKGAAKNANPIYNTIGFAENAALRNIDWASLISKIKILDVFFNSDYKLDYKQILGLATNLQYIEGGLLKMKERMNEVNKMGGGVSLKEEDLGKRFKYGNQHFGALKVVKYGYQPMMLSNFSPFEEDLEYHNILSLRKLDWGDVEYIDKKIQIELEEAEKMMVKQFERVIDEIRNPSDIFNLEPKLYIFKLSTGIGKTELLTNLDDALICFPDHSLKEEVHHDRMKVDHFVTPQLATFSNIELNNYITSLYDCGLYNIVSDTISKIADGKWKNHDIVNNDINLARRHIAENEICRVSRKTVLTTHSRGLVADFAHDYIIYDEDPLKYMVVTGETLLNFSDFDNGPHKKYVVPIEDFYRNKVGSLYLEDNNKFAISKSFQEDCVKKKRGDLIKLLNSDWLYKDPENVSKINWCKFNKMKLDKPTIILSATAAEDIYKKLFPGRVEVIDITNIKNVGVVEQFTNRSYSSSSLTKRLKEDAVGLKKELKSRVNNLPVITHNKHRDLFRNKNWSSYHFGNCSGGDTLKGQDIAVVGTPHKPMFVYLFYSKICNFDIQSCDNILVDKVIERNGFRFRAMTFENKDLQDIQLSLIEDELIQAAGRARVLRNMCSVKIFSNIPLTISDKINGKEIV